MACDRDGQTMYVKTKAQRELVDSGRLNRAVIGSEDAAACPCGGTVLVRVDGVSGIRHLGDSCAVRLRVTVVRHVDTTEQVEATHQTEGATAS